MANPASARGRAAPGARPRSGGSAARAAAAARSAPSSRRSASRPRAGSARGPRRSRPRAARHSEGSRSSRSPRRSPPHQEVLLAVDPVSVRPFTGERPAVDVAEVPQDGQHAVELTRERLGPDADPAFHAAEAALELARARRPPLVLRARGTRGTDARRRASSRAASFSTFGLDLGRVVRRRSSRRARRAARDVAPEPRVADAARPRQRDPRQDLRRVLEVASVSRKNWRSCVSTVGFPSREDTTTARPRRRARDPDDVAGPKPGDARPTSSRRP